jgi:Fe-S-cluster containining protein
MPSDLERLAGNVAAGLAFDHRDGATFLRMANDHCEHLRITETSLACGIYEARPHVCRDLEEGSPSCLAERLSKYLGQGRLVALRKAQTSPLEDSQ